MESQRARAFPGSLYIIILASCEPIIYYNFLERISREIIYFEMNY